MKTYTVEMEDGRIYSAGNTCAANAIQNALEKHLGVRVASCTCDGMRFDIPKHSALPLDWKPVKREQKQDNTSAMFNEDAIKAESINAKEKAGRTTVFGR